MAEADRFSVLGKALPVRDRVDMVVVGAGEAGIAAALAAAPLGRVLLVDEHPLDPGLIGLDVPYLFGGRVGPAAREPGRIEERVVAARPGLLAALEAGVEVALGTVAWGASGQGPFLLALADRDGAWAVEAGAVTLAAGARDVVVPVEGWTLPGVVGSRGLDSAHRLAGAFDGHRVVALGRGEVSWPDLALRLPEPVPVRVLGASEVEGLAWREDGAWREVACDTVVLAVDAAPAVELAEVLGAGLAWDSTRGGAVVASAPPGLSVVGDAAGTAPVERDGWMRLALAEPDALLCACEAVRASDLLALRPPRYLGAEGPPGGLAALPGAGQDAVKRLTRAGMGPCQGRRCRDSVRFLLGDEGPPATWRPPLRPLPLSVLAALDQDPSVSKNWVSWFGIPGQWSPTTSPGRAGEGE